MAQLVERDLAKVEAAGSSPVSRSLLHEKGHPVDVLFSCNRGTSVPRKFEVSAHIKWASVRAKPRSPGPRAPSRAVMTKEIHPVDVLFSCNRGTSVPRRFEVSAHIKWASVGAKPYNQLQMWVPPSMFYDRIQGVIA